MSTFEINSEALDAAHRTMTSVCDTIEAQRALHNQAHSGIEGMLANAAAVVLATTGLDPFSMWERWGFGGVAQTCSATSGTVEHVRGIIQQTVGEVSEAHRGELAPVLHDRAMALRSALDNAQERLWSITSLLNPGNLLQLLTSPWTILDHFSAARGALDLAHSLAQDYRDFLARLSAREQKVIEEIITLLAIPEVGLVPAGIAFWSEVFWSEVTSGSSHPAPQVDPVGDSKNPSESGDKTATSSGDAIVKRAEYYAGQDTYYPDPDNDIDKRTGEEVNGQYGFDCSGFVYRVFKDTGNSDLLKGNGASAADIHNQYNSGTPIAITNPNDPPPKGLAPGSLVFFNNKYGQLAHVAIVENVGKTIGDTTVLGATTDGDHTVRPLKISDFASYAPYPETAVRFVTFNR
ncbi:MAG TPA: CHAP domain-containing protein [Ktedonobacterales bacterium]